MTLAAQDNGSRHLTQWYKGMGFAQVGVNHRGFPQLEAPIGRVLGAVAQRREIRGFEPFAIRLPLSAPHPRRATSPLHQKNVLQRMWLPPHKRPGYVPSVNLPEATHASPSEEKTPEVEALAEPIKLTKQKGKLTTIVVKGLINCVGVIIKVSDPTDPTGSDFIEVIGGHFVTPEMFDVMSSSLNAGGQAFAQKVLKLCQDRAPNDLEVGFYVGSPAVTGAEPQSVREGRAAANALKQALNLGGEIVISGSSVKETI
jgi:hypothetical protein